jgi:hypothetical protein
MFDWYNTSTIENLRRQDEIAAAEKFRLIKEITSQDAPSGKRQQHILARLGVKMVDWGYRLQSRYDELVAVNVGHDIHGSHSSPC